MKKNINSLKSLYILTLLSLSLSYTTTSRAQSNEDRFQDLFVTSGYATAFGAALGAAALSFKSNPENNLRYVAIGASLGFFGGSIMGSYVIFSPMVSFNKEQDNPFNNNQTMMASNGSEGRIKIIPTYNVNSKRLGSLAGQVSILRF